jgi:hypothetical protein
MIKPFATRAYVLAVLLALSAAMLQIRLPPARRPTRRST